MYDSRIVSAQTLAAGFEDRIRPLRDMAAIIARCADATASVAAVQSEQAPDLPALVHRYTRAGTIERRRVDALVEQTGIEAVVGCRLILVRADQGAPGTTAAARFLHRRMMAALQGIDRLLPLAA